MSVSDPFALARAGSPSEAAKSRDLAALHAKAAGIVAELDLQLPTGEAGLIEAGRRLAELRARRSALYREFEIDFDVEEKVIEPTFCPLDDKLFEIIMGREPQTVAGIVIKLRLLGDRSSTEEEAIALDQCTAALEQLRAVPVATGRP